MNLKNKWFNFLKNILGILIQSTEKKVEKLGQQQGFNNSDFTQER